MSHILNQLYFIKCAFERSRPNKKSH